jgi:UDP-glucose 4-epimerase
MRIAITGASGNLGTALLRRLTADPLSVETAQAARTGDANRSEGWQPEEIVGVVRRPPEPVPPYDRVTWHAVDLAAADAQDRLAPAFAGVDAVVHLAWDFQPSRDVRYLERAAVGGTAAVLGAADAAGVRHLVHLSSLGAYAKGPKRPVDESWPTEGVATLAYSQHKVAAERLLDDYERAHPGGRLRIARLRPGLVVQRDAGSALLRYGVPPYVPAGLLRVLPLLPVDRSLVVPVVHADDVADAIVRVLDRRAEGPFNLAAEPPITRDDIAAALGARGVHVPAPVLSKLAGLTWRARLQPLDPGWLDLAFAVPLLDTTRARRELGWQPRTDARTALREVVDGMATAASAPSPALRPRTVLGQLRRLVTSGPVGDRRLP